MNKKFKKIVAIFLSVCLVIGGFHFIPQTAEAAGTLTNVANGRNGYTFMTSNANNSLNNVEPKEGFLYVGNGFSAINCCNENLANGNNLLGRTATTDEAAVYVDLGKDYDISSALIYQGSTNANFYDSYCRSYRIYYSSEQVSTANQGNITWSPAGQCDFGTIYSASTTKIKNAEYTSTTGDAIQFEDTVVARSIKIVFDKDACMGTGTNGNNTGITGTVSLLSVQIFGTEHIEETTTPSEEQTTESGEPDENLYASFADNLALKKQGYASSNLRSGATTPLTVNYLTDGNTIGTYYIIANTPQDTNPWFAVDLGSVQDINKVIVTPGADGGTYPNAYPVSYKIQVASETTAVSSASAIGNLTWNTVATVTEGTLAAKSVTFPRQNARFVRVLVDSYGDYCALYELSVFATDDSRLLGEEDEMMNVLFVGNSMTYYNTLCKVVEGFANAQGKQIQCTASTQGGRNLIYHTTYSGTVSAIQSGAYDVVILQDIVGSFDGDELMEGATTLTNMVKEYNPNAEVLLYMPWPVEGSLTGESGLLPYFTYHYIKTARTLGATLAPAGEAWYELYNKYTDVAWYCDDEKHPHAIGTFVSACSVYYALFPEAERVTIDGTNQDVINEIINDNIAYSGDAVAQYDAALLDDISYYAYTFTRAVAASVSDTTGTTKYTSVAGDYTDADDEVDKEGLTEVTGEVVDRSLFTEENGNIAVGCKAYASSERQNVSYVTDGNAGTRWESEWQIDPQWVYVDLGSVKNIDKVGFIWEGAYASKYYIQVSDDAQNWKTVAMVTATTNSTVRIDLESGVSGRYVRMYGTRRGNSNYGYSFYEMGVWEEYKVSVDGMEEFVQPGSKYILGDARYGYYSDGKMYPAGYEYIVDKDVSFTSVNELSVTMAQGAGIKLNDADASGIRFQATVMTDNENALNSDAIVEGMLITANDIYENNNSEIYLESTYALKNIENSGWYQGKTGTYCGSVVNIVESNYIRSFIAKAYVTFNYADGTSQTVYSDMSDVRSIAQVAQKLIEAGDLENYTDEQQAIIRTFSAAK